MRRHATERHAARHRSRLTQMLAAAMLTIIAALVVAACGSSKSSSSSSTPASSTPSSSTPGTTTGSSSGSGGTLTLGTKDFTEEFILGQLYKQALEAAGCKINYKENIGATEIIDKALTSGQIDAYPEYTGESVATVAKINKTVTSPAEEYALAKAFYAKRGQVMSNITPFFDTDAIAVKKSYATKYGLDHNRPEEGPALHAWSPAGVPEPSGGRCRTEERLRRQELHLQVAGARDPVPGAR